MTVVSRRGKVFYDNMDEFDRVKYQSVKDATSLITKECYFVKVDLKSAYRNIPLHPVSINLNLKGITTLPICMINVCVLEKDWCQGFSTEYHNLFDE